MMAFTSSIYGDHCNTRIMPHLPRGWRWATADETEDWENTPDIRQVRVGGTADEPETDLAVPA